MGFDANEIKQSARAAVQAGLYNAGRLLVDESLKKVPCDTGELARSIYIKSGENDLSLEVGYSADYAIAVHENGKKKFLLQPFRALKERILNEVKKSVEEVAG